MGELRNGDGSNEQAAAPAPCCGPNAAGCDCNQPADRSWLKLLVAGLVILAAAWLGIRSMVARPAVQPDNATAVASGPSGGIATPGASANTQPRPGNQGQPSCCGGGNAPPTQGGAPPKCGGGKPGCCGN